MNVIDKAGLASQTVDFERFRAIADEAGAILLADISHIAGLGRHLRMATQLVLGMLLSLACVPLVVVLYRHGQSGLVLALFPVGVATLAVCAHLNVSAHTGGFLPKLAVVAAACLVQLGLLAL